MMTSGTIVEHRDSQSLDYILKDPELFYPTGYKVLQSQAKNGFVKCTKVMHNGMHKLVFDISEYKTLDTILPTLRPEIFPTILKNLMDVVFEVKNNGFIHSTNIEISFDKIFVDCNNYKVFLVYLPIDTPVRQNDYEVFETSLKRIIASAIDQTDSLQTEANCRLKENLEDPSYTLERLKEILSDMHTDSAKYGSSIRRPSVMTDEDLQTNEESQQLLEPALSSRQEKAGFLKGLFKGKTKAGNPKKTEKTVKSSEKKSEKNPVKQNRKKEGIVDMSVNLQSEMEGGATEILDDIFTPKFILSGVKTPVKIDILINKPEFLIGKKEDAVDGVITCNNAISRVHCKIVFESGKYYVVDLGSANGTYINGSKIPPNQKIQIKDKDKVQLANSEFLLKSV